MADTLAALRKRIMFRSARRGTHESDLIIGGFARVHVDGMDAGQLEKFEKLLEQNDPKLLSWVVGTQKVPEDFDHDVMKLLQNFKNSMPTN